MEGWPCEFWNKRQINTIGMYFPNRLKACHQKIIALVFENKTNNHTQRILFYSKPKQKTEENSHTPKYTARPKLCVSSGWYQIQLECAKCILFCVIKYSTSSIILWAHLFIQFQRKSMSNEWMFHFGNGWILIGINLSKSIGVYPNYVYVSYMLL